MSKLSKENYRMHSLRRKGAPRNVMNLSPVLKEIVLVRISIAVNTMTTATLIKVSISLGLAYKV